MKFRMLSVIAFLLMGQLSNAQVVNIPDKAKTHFSKKYPSAAEVEWKNNVVNYTAKFELDGIDKTAHYSLDGVWTFTDQDKELESFPEDVQTSVKKSRYSDWKIESSALVENSKNEKLYRVEFKNGISKRYVFYDESGKEVRSSVKL